eukprot:8829458-Pyramimonas_sp.AAC.1
MKLFGGIVSRLCAGWIGAPPRLSQLSGQVDGQFRRLCSAPARALASAAPAGNHVGSGMGAFGRGC